MESNEPISSRILKLFDYSIHIDRLILERRFYSILFGVHTKTNRPVCVKVIRKQFVPDDVMDWVQCEIEKGKKLNHPGVIKIFQSFETKLALWIITEYHSGLTLNDYMKKKQCFTELETVDFLLQMSKIFKHINDLHIFHMNINPYNIIVEKETHDLNQLTLSKNDSTIRYKLIDLGFFRRLTFDEEKNSQMCEHLQYMAPEIIVERLYSNKVDIWSIACIAYEMCFGHSLLYRCTNLEDLVFRMKQGDFYINQMKNKSNKISIVIKNILQSMLERRYLSRMCPKKFTSDSFKKLLQNCDSSIKIFEQLFHNVLILCEEYFSSYESEITNVYNYESISINMFGEIYYKNEYDILDKICSIETIKSFDARLCDITFFLKCSHLMFELGEIHEKYKKIDSCLMFYIESMNQLKIANTIINDSRLIISPVGLKCLEKWIAIKFKTIIHKTSKHSQNNKKSLSKTIPKSKIWCYIVYLNGQIKYNKYTNRHMKQSKYMRERVCILIQYLIEKDKDSKDVCNLKNIFQKNKLKWRQCKMKSGETFDSISIQPKNKKDDKNYFIC